ncbi:hypothetical protein GCK72_020989 [Caenorhabditis remanei]|uniref:Uncharacterized protein n=1 Tax=Caenorhabditis remanei TaxID=31234 RepID=A0A6A5GGS6_CAERE|nr:hypothetical protein GCK72_020989 [Caenorhabditis remanei]KAF1754428.1 hypothetical protein GCK72_020989 [Caenorhabditis remanei]
MRFIFKLFLHFLIPILVDSYIISAGTVVYCLPQTNKECQSEMERKDAVLKNIGYGYPPLTSVLKNYTEQCQNVMGDLTTGNFKSEKQCFLKIVQEVCDSTYSDFFQKNYEDIVESYTTKPAVDEFCASPNDKFNRMQCDITFKKMFEGMRQLSLLDMANRSSSKIQSSLELSRNVQKCMDRLCFFYENEKNDTKLFTEVFQALPVDLAKIFKERPRLLEYNCMVNMTLGKFLGEQLPCAAIGNKNNCSLSTITHFCQEEIFADFGNLTVSMEPRKELYNTPEFEFSMLRNKKNRKKFVFTVKNEEHILVKSNIPDCLSELRKECQSEVEMKNAVVKSIGSTFPPLTDALKNFTEQCQNVMKCASGLECFKEKSEKKVFEKSCDNVGTNKYAFDYQCMIGLIMEVFDGSHNCTKDIIRGNITTENFKTHKQCFLKIFQEGVQPISCDFFQKNYEEVVELYTTRPAVDNGFCASPNDKFNRMQCDYFYDKIFQKLDETKLLSVSNRSDPMVQEILELSYYYQKCTDKLCLVDEYEKEQSNILDKVLQKLPESLLEIFKERPKLLEYSCMVNLTLLKFISDQCYGVKKINNCNLSIITKFCEEDILADFRNLTVSMELRKELYNTPEFEFSMFKNKKNQQKFVFTMKENILN